MSNGLANPSGVHEADRRRDALMDDIGRQLRLFADELADVRKMRWEAMGFEGEQPRNGPGFAFFCLQCGSFASMGTSFKDGEFYGTSFTCRNEECKQREVY